MAPEPFLLASGTLALLLGLAHSVLGERYLLRRLFRRALPPLFGSDDFTKRTLRFAWHALTVAWWGLGALVLLYAWRPLDDGARLALRAVAATFLVTALATLVVSEGRHASWLVELLIAAGALVPTLEG